MSRLTGWLAPRTTVRAHCDLPCGVYDPEQARIEAESCYKIVEKYNDSSDNTFKARAIHIKKERAELVKHHLDVLWHDYFKPEHIDKVPNLHDLFWNADKQASKVKASTDIADAQKLLDLINEVDAAWKATGGPKHCRAGSSLARRSLANPRAVARGRRRGQHAPDDRARGLAAYRPDCPTLAAARLGCSVSRARKRGS